MGNAVDVLALIEDILTAHHAPLRKSLPALRAATANTPLRRDVVELTMLLESHLPKEEAILFPNLAALARGQDIDGCGLLGPIRQMQHEHKQLHALKDALRARADEAGTARDDLLALLDDLEVHSSKEDDLLFPAGLALAGLEMPGPEEEPEPEPEIALPPRVSPRPQSQQQAPEPPGRRSLLRRVARRLLFNK